MAILSLLFQGEVWREALPWVASAIVACFTIVLARGERPHYGFPLIGMEYSRFGRMDYEKALARFLGGLTKIYQTGLREVQGKGFQILTNTGFKIILPPSYIDELRNQPNLSLTGFLENDFFASIPGFGAFGAAAGGEVIQETVRVKLTGSLAHVTNDLSDEMSYFTNEYMQPGTDWENISFYDISMRAVAQLSARAFLGKMLCRDKQWLDLSVMFTIHASQAARALRSWPRFTRRFIHWFLPETRTLRNDVAAARRKIQPELSQRNKDRVRYSADGKEAPKLMDTLQWMEDAAKGRSFDFVHGQLGLTFAAVHTTSHLLQNTLYDLCTHPEYIDLLRKEIIDVFGSEDEEWKKTSLYSLKMMDSVLKESQRVNTVTLSAISRRVEETTTLSDGTVLPKNAMITVPTRERMLDEGIWPGGDKWIGRRFYDLRAQPGQESKWQFVSTSSDHYGFGHGKHACPGRFFASNEAKVILVHVLMKYDWKFLPGQERPKSSTRGSENLVDPKAILMYKSRKSEIQFPGEKISPSVG